MFTLALIFASTNKSYSQTYINYVEGTPQCTPAVPLTCTTADNELQPLPGKLYNYGVNVNPGTYQSIHWFVTDDPNVIATASLTTNVDVAGGDYVLTAGSTYNSGGNTSSTVTISWKSFPASDNVLLVAYVKGAGGCSDNVEVYKIEPSFAFTLDVAGLLADGTVSATATECLSPVESATYSGGNLTMDYGENWVFFSVNAANFVDSWKPDFSAVAANGSTIGTIEWATATEAAKTNGTWNANGVPVMASTGAGGAVGAAGECIIVRVQVDHAGIEHDASAAAEVVTLSINGVMSDPAEKGTANEYTNTTAYSDLDNGASSCVNNVTDTEDFTLTPRPSVTTNTTVGTGDKAFEPKN